ncbi:hypothetical protein [Deinococcus roseus]|uniref:Uncharacterized protein n=1 Tax=Deinococcus roseus TaxID=392414 RepID=A0ABQ2DDH6_9DEIO|nr:hypothetical protein [Deinococcus roseus]GGJ54220.1 hypothetical protein GCM10008938_45370 [Deinococcus roseus]
MGRTSCLKALLYPEPMHDLYQEEVFIENSSEQSMYVELEMTGTVYDLQPRQVLKVLVTYDLPRLPGASHFYVQWSSRGLTYYVANTAVQSLHLVRYTVWIDDKIVGEFD